jgi:threonine synthase
LAPAVAAAAAAHGLRAVVLLPADLEPAKVAQARALGATVVRVDGPYDAVNRLCLELTDELEGWAVVNVNVRPYYAEGSKTIAYEVARQLGWRTPDVVVAPLASGSL